MKCKYYNDKHDGKWDSSCTCEGNLPDSPSWKSVRDELPSDLIPTTWLDPLLSGKDRIIGEPLFDCSDIEQLLKAIKIRIQEWERSHLPSPPEVKE